MPAPPTCRPARLLINGNQSGATGPDQRQRRRDARRHGHDRRRCHVADGGTLAPGQQPRHADDQRQPRAQRRLDPPLRVRPGRYGRRRAQRSHRRRRRSDARRHAQRHGDGRRQLRPRPLSRDQLYGALTDNGLARHDAARQHVLRADVGRQPGQPGQHGGSDAQLLGRRRRAQERRRDPGRQRHWRARRRRQLDRR